MRQFYSFLDGIPTELEASGDSCIQISTRRSRDGMASLYWKTKPGGFLHFYNLIPFSPFNAESVSKAMDSFVFWIYGEAPTEGKLRINFLKNGRVCCWFDFYLDFVGWRTAWVAYERDMQGEPEPDMDGFQVVAQTPYECSLYIDQIIPLVKIDPRYHTPDFQVPNIHQEIAESANAHWLALLKFWRQQERELTYGGKSEDAGEAALIAQRFQEYLLQHVEVLAQMEDIRVHYVEYELDRGGRRVSWHLINDSYPEVCRGQLVAETNALDFRNSGILMRDMAFLWHKTNDVHVRQELEGYLKNLFLHLQTQGYACGSGIGTTHHSGYQMREFYQALFLMRDALNAQGLLQMAADTVCWFSGHGRIFGTDDEIRLESLDTFNTLSQGILAGALMQEDMGHMHLALKGVQRWLSSCMLPAPGLEGPFKKDHSMFHHANHYPAYAMGGLTGVVPVIYCLSHTSYRLAQKAHQCLKDSILAFRLYCNHLNWPIGMAARHPLGDSEHSGIRTLSAFQYLALSGTPNGAEEVDTAVGAAYMRLLPYVKEVGAMEFSVEPEPAPSGHWNFNYGCIALHRRNEWLVSVRGFSRYIWGNESYVANNLYGRYIAYGQLQILNKGNPITNKGSGFVHDGWDWNFWPGTTAIGLPFEKLRADVRNVDTYSGFEEMLISDESYCGGTGLEGNGVFALKLHEHGKYDGSHRARKSYFFLDDVVVCLGSDIENTSEYSTFTTLFQTCVEEGEGIRVDGKEISVMPYYLKSEGDKPLYCSDSKGNGYYIPMGQQMEVSMKCQISCSQSEGTKTEGNFAKAVFCHGSSPSGAAYEYAVLVDGADRISRGFAEKIPYKVLQKDFRAHILSNESGSEIYYACYEPVQDLPYGMLHGVDTPCLIVEKHQNGRAVLAVCDPDLRLYEGIEADQVDENGKQVEVSLYSRKWFAAESGHHILNLSLSNGEKREIECFDGRTVILCC